VTGRRYNQA